MIKSLSSIFGISDGLGFASILGTQLGCPNAQKPQKLASEYRVSDEKDDKRHRKVHVECENARDIEIIVSQNIGHFYQIAESDGQLK